MAHVFGIPKAWFFNKKSKQIQRGLLGLLLAIIPLNWEYLWNNTGKNNRESQEKEERQLTDSLYKGLKGAANIPTDDLIPLVRRSRNHHSLTLRPPLKS